MQTAYNKLAKNPGPHIVKDVNEYNRALCRQKSIDYPYTGWTNINELYEPVFSLSICKECYKIWEEMYRKSHPEWDGSVLSRCQKEVCNHCKPQSVVR